MRFTSTFAQTAENDPVDNARRAVNKIKADFARIKPSFVVFFAATKYDPGTVAAEMQAAFPDAVTLGCTAAGEACDDKILEQSVVAMAFAEDALAFSETVLVLSDKSAAERAARCDIFSDATAALNHLARNLDRPLLDIDYHKYIGFMLGDSTCPFTEGVIERAGELMNVFLAGGIAGGGNYEFEKQFIFYKGEAYNNGAAVLALWKPQNGFALLKTQAVDLSEKQLTITKADKDRRIIWEFNGRPALEAYAEAVGVRPEDVGIPEFDNYPLAVMADDEPFLCSAVGVVEGGGLQMYMRFVDDMRMTVTKTGKIVEVTEKALSDKLAEMDVSPAGILHINCVCRYKVLHATGQYEEFGRLFAGCPHIAFASMGEMYVNMVGLTSVMILFK